MFCHGCSCLIPAYFKYIYSKKRGTAREERCGLLRFGHLPSSHRAFRINELKTEVTNRLAMLEKRVECKWCVTVRRALWGSPTLSFWLQQHPTAGWLLCSFQWRDWRWWKLRSARTTSRSSETRRPQEAGAGEIKNLLFIKAEGEKWSKNRLSLLIQSELSM